MIIITLLALFTLPLLLVIYLIRRDESKVRVRARVNVRARGRVRVKGGCKDEGEE